jgi:hypothetical protein
MEIDSFMEDNIQLPIKTVNQILSDKLSIVQSAPEIKTKEDFMSFEVHLSDELFDSY